MLVGSCIQCRGATAIWFVNHSDDVLRHRRLSRFGHVAHLDPGVPAHDALRLMVDTYEANGQLEKTDIMHTAVRRPRV